MVDLLKTTERKTLLIVSLFSIIFLGIKRHISCLESKNTFDIKLIDDNSLNVVRVLEKLSTSVRVSECNLNSNLKKNLLEFNSTVRIICYDFIIIFLL